MESPPPLRWFYTVAQRRLIDAGRRGRFLPIPTAVTDEEAADDDAGYRPEVAQALARAVAALPESQRGVVVAKLWEGRSLAESLRGWGRAKPLARCAWRAAWRSCATA